MSFLGISHIKLYSNSLIMSADPALHGIVKRMKTTVQTTRVVDVQNGTLSIELPTDQTDYNFIDILSHVESSLSHLVRTAD